MVASAAIETSHYPSAKLRLIIRFEEFGSVGLVRTAPSVPTTVRRGTRSQSAKLVAIPDPEAPAGINRLLLAPSGTKPPPGGPQGQSKSSDNRTFVINGIIPKTATWTQNGIRSASTLSAKIKLIDCPLDPRTIRSCAVEYLLGVVTSEDYARGIAGTTRTVSQGQQGSFLEPLNLIPDGYRDAAGQQRTNLRFQGWVDKWEVQWNEDEEATVSLECRDNTSLLLGVEVPSALVVAAGKPIDQAIADYLSNFPTFAGLSVEYRPPGATPPKLSTALAGTAFQPQLGPASAKGGGGSSKLTVWDYLTDVCGAIGHVVRLDGTTVVVQPPSTLFSNSTGAARSDDVYKPRTVDGTSYPRRTFIWGRGLVEMTCARDFAMHAPANVEVRCYSPRRKKTLVARFPDPKTQADKLIVKALPGDGSTDQVWKVYRVRGVEDPATLHTIAENIYTAGRNEMTISLKTKNLTSFGGQGLDPDVLDMKVADSFDLLVAREQDYGTLEATEYALLVRAREFLQALGFDADMAGAYASAYVDGGFQTTFRLHEMTAEWDAEEEGVSLEIHGVNYVEVRLDKVNR